MKFILLLCLLPVLSFSQEHARILSMQTSFRILNKAEVEIEERIRIKINSDQGRAFAQYFNFIDQFRRISDVNIDIYDMKGYRVKRLRRSDGFEIGFNPNYEIQDSKIFLLRADYQNYPFIMEVHSIIRINGFLSLPTWMPRETFNLSVDQAKLTIIRPIQLPLGIKEENIHGESVKDNGNLITTFEVHDLPFKDRIVRYRDFYEEEVKVLVSPRNFEIDNYAGSFESWTTFGDWFLDLNSNSYTLDGATQQFIALLDKSSPRMVIQRLYEFMQDKVRYVSIQLGIGGFRALPTEEVEKYGYGDCKALSAYMKNMLDYAGIKSNFILVRAGEDVADVEKDFPSNQFNHVFLGIPLLKDTVLLECTSQISPYDYVGTFTDDRNVLWIDKNNSKIIRSRIYDHTKNNRKSFINISLTESGDALLEYKISNEGFFFDEITLLKGAPATYVEKHNLKKFDFNDFTIKYFSFNQPDRKSAIFNSEYKIQVKGLANLIGTRLVLPIVPTTPVMNFVDRDEMMKYYCIKRGLAIDDEITITLPDHLWIYNLPEKSEVKSRFGQYSLETKFENGELRIRRVITLFKGDYKVTEYEEFHKFYQQLIKLESRKLLLNSKT